VVGRAEHYYQLDPEHVDAVRSGVVPIMK